MANHPRGEWSDVHASFARMGQAVGVAIHHTASRPAGEHYDPAYLRRIEHGEIASGYSSLAYHTMGFLDGDTAESRPYGARGAATGGHNDTTIALCAVGYFHPPYYDQPTDALVNAFAAEIYWLRQSGFLVANGVVRPHAWWTAGSQWATACCGSEFIPLVETIEARSYGPAPVPSPVPSQEGDDDGMIIIVIEDPNPNTTTALVMQGSTIVSETTDAPNMYGVPNNLSAWRESVDKTMKIQFLTGPFDGPAIEALRKGNTAA